MLRAQSVTFSYLFSKQALSSFFFFFSSGFLLFVLYCMFVWDCGFKGCFFCSFFLLLFLFVCFFGGILGLFLILELCNS